MRMRTVILLGAMLAIAAAVGADELGARLEQRVGEVLAGKLPLAEVQIDVVWGRPDRTSLQVWGNGVGIWGREKQFKLNEDEVRGLLPLFGKFGFYDMPERPKPKAEAARSPEGPAIMRALELRVGDLHKAVLQTDRVNTLKPLEDLVSALFSACTKAADAGIAAKDLASGLDLLAKGTLAPEALTVTLNEPVLGKERPEGRMISIGGGVISVERLATGKSPVRAEPRKLRPEDIRALAALLRDAGWPGVPQNVTSEGYTDLTVTVLRHSHMVQARKFAGKAPAAQSTDRDAIEKLRAAIGALADAGAK
ncbi:MAG: hypothetical protein AB2L07_08370 [Thermoanaerobaculaceae bacterium]